MRSFFGTWVWHRKWARSTFIQWGKIEAKCKLSRAGPDNSRPGSTVNSAVCHCIWLDQLAGNKMMWPKLIKLSLIRYRDIFPCQKSEKWNYAEINRILSTNRRGSRFFMSQGRGSYCIIVLLTFLFRVMGKSFRVPACFGSPLFRAWPLFRARLYFDSLMTETLQFRSLRHYRWQSVDGAKVQHLCGKKWSSRLNGLDISDWKISSNNCLSNSKGRYFFVSNFLSHQFEKRKNETFERFRFESEIRKPHGASSLSKGR
jgi:hypothetical protein